MKVPYKDPDDRRRYDRDRRRRIRAAGSASRLDLAPAIRLHVAEDVEALLAEAVILIRRDTKAKGVEKARALGYVASIGLRFLEARELQDRVEALELVLERRRPA
jgi:hypothetical protein